MYAVAEKKQINDCADVYRETFYKKFQREPKIDNLDRAALEFLIKQIGFEDTLDALKHYFTMREEWFVKQGFSIKCFKEQINAILASLGASDSHQTAQRSIRVESIFDTLSYYSRECTAMKGRYPDKASIRKAHHLKEDGSEDNQLIYPY